jgi:MFS family permease
MTLALTIVGDIVSPRERGRYQGYFGGVFAIASVGGPLLGGFFVDNLTWRWVFYINIPLGLLALIVTSAVLRLPFHRREHAVDYVGAGLMVSGVSALLLVTVWGGSQYAWLSPTIVGLTVAGLALSVAFLWWETRVPEPILPPYLFGLGVFRVSTSVIFVVGFALFGTIIYLSVYLQLFHDVSPTKSGLLLTPLMGGILAASILSGRRVSHTGRVRRFPIVGTALLTIGMALLAQLDADTSLLLAALFMLITGAGVGMVMQNLTLAVQNAVPRTEMGAATSSVSFFRSLGGSFGTAVFGAILFDQLDRNLRSRLPADARPKGDLHALIQSPSVLRALPPAVKEPVVSSFIDAMHVVFYAGAGVCAVAFLISLTLKETTLRTTSAMSPAEAEPGAEPALASGVIE